ncbi:hypothetical protein H0H93_006598 [Arthromyces matolae]|nr:hypothetical protein H0H93_006598 [Arthromyces matolae]
MLQSTSQNPPSGEPADHDGLDHIRLDPPFLHHAPGPDDFMEGWVPEVIPDPMERPRAIPPDRRYRDRDDTPTEADYDQDADDERVQFHEDDEEEQEEHKPHLPHADQFDFELANQTADLQRRIDQGFQQLTTLNRPTAPEARRGALTLKVTPKLTKNATRRGNEQKKLADNVRKHFVKLVGLDNLLTPLVTAAEATAWERSVAAHGEDANGLCCTASDFRYYLLGPPHHPWNRSAAKVFAADYITHNHLPNTLATAASIIGAFYIRLKTLRRKYMTQIQLVSSDPQRLRRDQRKRTLFNRRLEVAQMYPFLNRHVRLIQQLGVEGMSSDESDHEEAIHNNTVGSLRPRYEIILPRWRAVELSRWLHIFDSVYSVARRSQGPSRGDHPRIRHFDAANVRFSLTNSFVTHLPRCLYRPEWLRDRHSHFISWTLQPSDENYPLVHDNDNGMSVCTDKQRALPYTDDKFGELSKRTLTTKYAAQLNLGRKDQYREGVERLGLLIDGLLDKECDTGLKAKAWAVSQPVIWILQHHNYGFQLEAPDPWLNHQNPWELPRLDVSYEIRFYGQLATDGSGCAAWTGGQEVLAIAYNVMIPGYKTSTTNNLRLWESKPKRGFDLNSFNVGKELRLKQQYFWTAASLADIIRRFKNLGKAILEFPDYVAVQLNDTHPTLAIPELMRILIDEEDLDWNVAWNIVTNTFFYTNHTVLPEALEKWPVPLIEHVLPRHMQIIYDIVAAKLMASPSELVQTTILKDFVEFEGISKFGNVTNGTQDHGSMFLESKNPQIDNKGVSWCKLEATVSDPKDINPFSETDPNAPKDTPPLTVVSLSVRSIVNHQENKREVACENVREGKVKIDDFIIFKRLGKAPEDYPDAKSQPHVQVALRMKAKGGTSRAQTQAQAQVHILRPSELSSRSRPTSEYQFSSRSPDRDSISSSISGTTIARALMANTFVLSSGPGPGVSSTRSSKYRSGGSALSRMDSAVLPKSPSYWNSKDRMRETIANARRSSHTRS